MNTFKVNDIIRLGAFTYTILEVRGFFALFSWIESSGQEKTRWVKVV